MSAANLVKFVADPTMTSRQSSRLLLLILLGGLVTSYYAQSFQIFHVIDNSLWGEVDGSALQGIFSCYNQATKGKGKTCELISTDAHITGRSKPPNDLLSNIRQKYIANVKADSLTISLYNIHTWAPLSAPPHYPDACLLPTHLSMVESEESTVRFRKLFSASFPGYNANSTTHPQATVQRSYVSTGIFNESLFLPLKPPDKLIPGAAYVASTCHRGRHAPKREDIVTRLQQVYRVDSLGKCHRTSPKPDTVSLKMGRNAAETLRLKQEAISHYQFYLAFENNIEPGYVTEKVFDALIAGTVPVYLGPTEDCRKMLPHPKAAIFLDDFGDDVEKLSVYLNYLAKNETAYEEHRQWRRSLGTPSRLHLSPLLSQPWPCRICNWALETLKKSDLTPSKLKKDCFLHT